MTTISNYKKTLENLATFKETFSSSSQKDKNQMKRDGVLLFSKGEMKKFSLLKQKKLLKNEAVYIKLEGWKFLYEKCIPTKKISSCGDCPICLEEKSLFKSCIQCNAEICGGCIKQMGNFTLDILKCPLCRKSQDIPFHCEDIEWELKKANEIGGLYKNWYENLKEEMDAKTILSFIKKIEEKGLFEYDFKTFKFIIR